MRKKFAVDFIGLQETHVSGMSSSEVSSLWGCGGLEFDSVDAVGRSGGLVNMWNGKVFKKTASVKGRYFLLTTGILVRLVYA